MSSFAQSHRRPDWSFWTGCLAVAILILPDAAPAQTFPDTGTGGTGGTSPTLLTKDDFAWLLEKKVNDEWVAFNATDADTFFNRARCLCNEPLRVRVLLKPTSAGKVSTGKRAEIRLKAGDQTCVCTGANCTNLNCKDIDTPRDLTALVNGGLEFVTTARAVFEAGRSAMSDSDTCSRDEMQNLWIWMDSDDAGADTEITDASYPVRLDGVPPDAPTGLAATPGNKALQVSWNALGYLDDLQGYIVFCSRGEGTSVFPGVFKPEYTTPANVCAGQQVQALTQEEPLASDARAAVETPAEGAHGPAPAKLAALDPEFACSKIITGGKAEIRLFELQNGIPYVVGVSSVDRRGNASPIEDVVLQVPIPTLDFYRNYRQEGGSAEGGFCTVGRGGGPRARWLAIVLFAPLLVLLARRGRKGRRP
jgi:hypothetical protein